MSILDAPGISKSQADSRYVVNWPVVTGETGVLNQSYPVGDVRRYGVFPDGVTNWEVTYASRMTAIKLNSTIKGITIKWVPGLYKTGLNMSYLYSGSRMHFENGSLFGDVIHLVSGDVAGSGTYFGMSGTLSRASNVVTLTSASPHSMVTADIGRPLVVQESVDPTFNGTFTLASIPTSSTVTWVQTGADLTSADAWATSRPVKNIRWTGVIATCDRFGVTVVSDAYVEKVRQVDDPSSHISGSRGRGTHIYYAVTDLCIPGGISVEGCGAATNTWAGVSIDGDTMRPRRVTIGDIDIVSDVNGAFIQCDDSIIGNIRVTDYGLSASTNTAPGTSAAQQNRCSGVWIHRAGNTSIGDIHAEYPRGASRPYAYGPLLVSQTGSTTIQTPVTAGNVFAPRANDLRGICIGDPDSPTTGSVDFSCASIQLTRAGAVAPLTAYPLLYGVASSQSGAGALVKLSCRDIRLITDDLTQCVAFQSYTAISNEHVTIRGKGCLLESNARGTWGKIFARYQGPQTSQPNLLIAATSPNGGGLIRFVLPTDTVDLRQWLDVGGVEFDCRGSPANIVNSTVLTFYSTNYATVGKVRLRDARADTAMIRIVGSNYINFGPSLLFGLAYVSPQNRPVRIENSVGVSFKGGKWDNFKEQPSQVGTVSGTLENIDLICTDTNTDATRWSATSWNQLKTTGFNFI